MWISSIAILPLGPAPFRNSNINCGQRRKTNMYCTYILMFCFEWILEWFKLILWSLHDGVWYPERLSICHIDVASPPHIALISWLLPYYLAKLIPAVMGGPGKETSPWIVIHVHIHKRCFLVMVLYLLFLYNLSVPTLCPYIWYQNVKQCPLLSGVNISLRILAVSPQAPTELSI